MSRATPRVSDKAARGIRDSWVLSLPGWLLSPPRPSGSRGRSRAGWRRPGGGPWRPRIPEPPAQRAWCPVARPGRDCELFGGAGHVLGRDSSLGPASCCQSRCLGTWSGLRPRDFPKIRRFLAAAVAARFKSSSPRIPGEWGRRGRARGSGPRAALCSTPPPQLSSSFLPFITFALPDSPFFNPYVRAVYARSWASGRLHRRQASVRLSVLLFSKPVLEGARSAESGEAGPNPGLALSPPCLLAVSLHP